MKTNNIYEFYNLTKKEQKKLIGSWITEEIYSKNKKAYPKPCIYKYLVIELDDSSMRKNYNSRYGLIGTFNIELTHPYLTYNQIPYWGIYVKSPDDWDFNFTLYGDDVEKRFELIHYMKTKLKCKNRNMTEVFNELKDFIGCGEFYT